MIVPRTWMIEQRTFQGLSVIEMALKADTAADLLEILEQNSETVTHPIIAKRIAAAYGMTEEQEESLIPVHRRPHSDKYDPMKYVKPVTFEQKIDYEKLELKDND